MTESNSEKNGENSAWAIVVIIAFVVVIAILGLFKAKPSFNVTGLWQGNGEYLFVKQKDDDLDFYTSIPGLHHDNWIPNYNTSSIQIKDHREKIKANISLFPPNEYRPDRIEIELDTGEKYNLKVKTEGSLNFFKSMSLYTKCRHFLGIIYPDGIYRLLVLYGLGLLFILSIGNYLLGLFQHVLEKIEKFIGVLLLLLAPFLIGYILGIIKWIFWGWWDALLIGKIIIIVMIIILLTPLAMLLYQLNNFKEKEYVPKTTIIKVIIWVLLLSDIFGLISNFSVVISWLG